MDIDIAQLPDIVRRRWIYPAVAAIACGLLALGYVLYQTPLYHATVELAVDPASLENPAAGADERRDPDQGRLETDSQVYIMRSAEVLSAVVDALDLGEDDWLAPPAAGGLLSSLTGGGTAQTAEERQRAALAALREAIDARRAGQSLVFTITMKHPSAETAADIANATAETYLARVDESRADNALRASMTWQAQADELRQRLQRAQNEVETFKAEHGLYSTKTNGLIDDQRIETLSQEIAEAQRNVESRKAAYDQATELSVADVETGALPEALQSTALVNLRTRYAQLRDRQARLAVNLGENHPQLRAVRSQLDSMRDSMEDELSRVREALRYNYRRAQSDLETLREQYAELTAATGESGDARTHLAQLESNAAALENLYQTYLMRAENIGGQQALDPGTSRIISAALPPTHAAGAPKLITLIAGMLFGTMLGTGIAVLREQFGGEAGAEPDTEPADGRAPAPGRGLQGLHDAAGIPVVARANAARRWRAGPAFLRKRAAAKGTAGQGDQLAVARVAELIDTAFARRRAGEPAHILFLRAGEAEAPFDVAAVARTLAETGARVFHADGSAAPVSAPTPRRVGSLLALVDEPPEDTVQWGRGRLHFAPVAAASPGARADGPVFYLAEASAVGGWSAPTALLDDAYAAIVIARADTPAATLEALGRNLEPWRERLLGMIAVET